MTGHLGPEVLADSRQSLIWFKRTDSLHPCTGQLGMLAMPLNKNVHICVTFVGSPVKLSCIHYNDTETRLLAQISHKRYNSF